MTLWIIIIAILAMVIMNNLLFKYHPEYYTPGISSATVIIALTGYIAEIIAIITFYIYSLYIL